MQQNFYRQSSAGQSTDPLVFPKSVQSDLFNYLKPEQQDFVRPILRVLKKRAQEELCYSLLDYLESGDIIPPANFTLGALLLHHTCRRRLQRRA